MQTVIMISGGADSTCIAYWMLKNSDDDIILHHIDFSTTGPFPNLNRKKHDLISKAQEVAMPRILEILSEIRPFKYETSVLQPNREFVLSPGFWYLHTGAAAILHHDADRFMTGITPECMDDPDWVLKHEYRTRFFNLMLDYGTGEVRSDDVEHLGQKVFHAIGGHINQKKVVWESPLVTLNWYREDVVKNLPFELRTLVVTCDAPTADPGSGEWTRCGQCYRCKIHHTLGGLEENGEPPNLPGHEAALEAIRKQGS